MICAFQVIFNISGEILPFIIAVTKKFKSGEKSELSHGQFFTKALIGKFCHLFCQVFSSSFFYLWIGTGLKKICENQMACSRAPGSFLFSDFIFR